MKKSAENSVKVLLKDTILALCRNTLAYRSKVSVEGLIGVTLDDDEIILVSINDMIRGDDGKERDDSSESSDSESDGGGSSKRKKRRRRKRSGSRDGQDGAPTPKKSMDQGIKIKGEDNEDVMVIIKEETPEENPELQWMKDMDPSFQHQAQDQAMYGNFPNLSSSMGAAHYQGGPGPSAMASQQTQGQGPGQQQDTSWSLANISASPIGFALKCFFCTKMFVTENVLQEHMKKCGKKRHVCEICGQRNYTPADLRKHMKTHNKNE